MPPWFQKKTPDSDAAAAPKAPVAAKPAAKGKGVKVSQLLSEDLVLVDPAAADKNALLDALVRRLCAQKGFPSPEAFLAKVLEREGGISTTLDTGLSLPHARMDDLPGIVAAMAVVPKGLPDPKQPDLVIRLMFLFFSPNKPESFPLHLQLLRAVSSTFQPALIDRLAQAPTPAAALELVRGAESA